MIKDIAVLNQHSQIRELGSELRYNIIRELIRGAATCQQLANIYGISKQKMHYNLNKLFEENLIDRLEYRIKSNAFKGKLPTIAKIRWN